MEYDLTESELVRLPDCDKCGRHETGSRIFLDANGDRLNLCQCCDELGGHSKECECQEMED